MRGNNRMSSGVKMVCNDNIFSSPDFIDIMNPGTFNGLIKMTFEQKTQSFSAIMAQSEDEFSNGFPMENFGELWIGIYSTAGMKSRIRDRVFRLDLEHEESYGHYIMAKLDMKNSKLIFSHSEEKNATKTTWGFSATNDASKRFWLRLSHAHKYWASSTTKRSGHTKLQCETYPENSEVSFSVGK